MSAQSRAHTRPTSPSVCGPALPATVAHPHPSIAPVVNGQWAPIISFAHYPVTAPLSHTRHRGGAHDTHSLATARAPGPYSSPRTLSPARPPHLQTTPSSPLSPTHARAQPRQAELCRAVSCWSLRPRRASPHSRFARCRRCVRALKLPKVRIVDCLPFSLSLFSLCYCVIR